MFIVTEVCTDNKCKLVRATLHWDALGYFRQIEVSRTSPLTKKKHEPFDDADYDKLQRILQDRNSILRTASLAYLANPVPDKPDADAVDGLSGATPATFRAAVVEDAAYTTWVMWHWANGPIVDHIRELTIRDLTPEYLNSMLHAEDRRFVDFALKYIAEHHADQADFIDAVVHVLETGDREHVGIALDYLAGAIQDKHERYARWIDSCERMNRLYVPMVLAKFAADENLPEATMDSLAECLDRLPYFPIHLILRLLEDRKHFSSRVEAEVAELLDNKDFFIARRAYEYLKKQNLMSATDSKLEAFANQHRDRL
jgi:hypothetical protein